MASFFMSKSNTEYGKLITNYGFAQGDCGRAIQNFCLVDEYIHDYVSYYDEDRREFCKSQLAMYQEKFKEDLAQYEETMDLWFDEEEKRAELLREQYDKQLEALTYKVELEISLEDAKKMALETLNVSEEDIMTGENEYVKKVKEYAREEKSEVVMICAKIESELAELSDEEKIEFLGELGIQESGMDQLIRKTYSLLGLATFFTVGSDEVNSKSTYPSLLGFDRSKELVNELTDRAVTAVSMLGDESKVLSDYVIDTQIKAEADLLPDDFMMGVVWGDLGNELEVNPDVMVEASSFNTDLTSEEINILAILMMCAWLQRQVTSIENIRMKYSGADFKMTSQANHLAKLLSLLKETQRQSHHMQRLYKRRKIVDGGQYESNWSVLRTNSAIDY